MVTLLNQASTFESYMVGFVVKNIHKKDSCHDEIRLNAQSIDTILGSIINKTERI